ncbi:MAG: GDP-mannose 4,6-dehydratase [Candidatus Zapsychrus exili]|nr:GDP-mannose 4,6-dehydratase [Candidatus Zapsychrus exili]
MKNFWKNRRVLITGANGFLAGWLSKDLIDRGAQLCALIYQKNPVSIFETKKLAKDSNVIYGDILDFNSMKKMLKDHNIQTIFHLGAQAICKIALDDPTSTLDANIRGTINVLEAVRVTNPRIQVVVASSDKAYGIHRKLPYKETYPRHGEFPYEVSKSCADLISQMYYNTYSLPVCVVRSGNLYGGGDSHFSRIFPKTIHRISRNLRPNLINNSIRDYLYVQDAADAYRMIAEQMNKGIIGETFNTGHNKPVPVSRVLNLIARTMGKPHLKPIHSKKSTAEIPSQYLSIAKIKKMIGWKPEISLEEGTKRTVDWYSDFFKSNNVKLSD